MTQNEGESSVKHAIVDFIKNYAQNHNACSNDTDICGKIFVDEVLRPVMNELQSRLRFLIFICVQYCQLQADLFSNTVCGVCGVRAVGAVFDVFDLFCPSFVCLICFFCKPQCQMQKQTNYTGVL